VELPPPLQRFRETTANENSDGALTDPPVRIAFPPDRAEVEIDEAESPTVVVKAEGGTLPLTWLVDGKPLQSNSNRREVQLPAATSGFVGVSVIDAQGRADRVTFRLK
jgi:penicillin-binding protein 1C